MIFVEGSLKPFRIIEDLPFFFFNAGNTRKTVKVHFKKDPELGDVRIISSRNNYGYEMTSPWMLVTLAIDKPLAFSAVDKSGENREILLNGKNSESLTPYTLTELHILLSSK